MIKRPFLFCFLILTIAISCGSNKNSPEYVTEQYLLALKEKNWDKAKSYADEEAKKNIDALMQSREEVRITEVTGIKCKIKGTRANCTFCCVVVHERSEVILNKINGKWIVSGVKETKSDEVQVDESEN